MILRHALEKHYVNHGLPADGGASSPTFTVHIGPLRIPLPNPPARKRAVFYHDTNHVLTGYNTVFSEGEMAIAAFELGNGCGPFLIAWLINFGVFIVGLMVCPGDMFRAFARGRRAQSVYERTDGTDALAAMTVDSIRNELRLDARNAAPDFADRVLFGGWALFGVAVAIAPVAGLIAWLR